MSYGQQLICQYAASQRCHRYRHPERVGRNYGCAPSFRPRTCSARDADLVPSQITLAPAATITKTILAPGAGGNGGGGGSTVTCE